MARYRSVMCSWLYTSRNRSWMSTKVVCAADDVCRDVAAAAADDDSEDAEDGADKDDADDDDDGRTLFGGELRWCCDELAAAVDPVTVAHLASVRFSAVLEVVAAELLTELAADDDCGWCFDCCCCCCCCCCSFSCCSCCSFCCLINCC